MKLQVVAIGKKMPDWVTRACDEYQKRLPRELGFAVRELSLAKRGSNTPAALAREQEGEAMLAAIPQGHWVVALDINGKAWSTEQLSEQLANWRMEGRDVSLLIGGPDGLSRDCLKRADVTWSLSTLTLPHPLVRVLLVEQLYRAWSILNNHPYHK